MVVWLFVAVPWVCLRFVSVVFPDNTHLLFLIGQGSDPVPVLSDVPQRSVLGQIMFIIFINDLPDNIRSSVRLFAIFADDCVLYRNTYSIQNCLTLQDLTCLGQWESNWQMKFNVDKCHSMGVTRHKTL